MKTSDQSRPVQDELAELRRNAEMQSIVGRLLRLSLEKRELNQMMAMALDIVLTVPGFDVAKSGGVFLADAEHGSNTLVLCAERGSRGIRKRICSHVRFGECLCGRAAQEGRIVFAPQVGEQREPRGKNMPLLPCLSAPFLADGDVVGVLCLKLQDGHRPGAEELEMLGMIADTFAGVLVRERAQEEQRRLSAAIAQVDEAVVITTRGGTVEYVNPAFERLTGFSRDEVVGRTPRLWRSGRHGKEFYRSLWQTIEDGRTWRGRITNRTRRGKLIQEEATISPIRGSTGQITSFVSVGHDITPEQELEEGLQRTQRLEALGCLAGGIAHDFNNVLGAQPSHRMSVVLAERPVMGTF